ncbi:MAG: molecular chaperone DnaJ, partial [Clostridium perfringens]|nr:molecular chaperone DnaJ [Clostridium perfringens]
HMVVEVPKHLNKEQEEALKAFMKASGESVDDIGEKDEGFFSKFKKKK